MSPRALTLCRECLTVSQKSEVVSQASGAVSQKTLRGVSCSGNVTLYSGSMTVVSLQFEVQMISFSRSESISLLGRNLVNMATGRLTLGPGNLEIRCCLKSDMLRKSDVFRKSDAMFGKSDVLQKSDLFRKSDAMFWEV